MASRKHRKRGRSNPMIFDSWNYKVLAVSLLLVIAGFTAMNIENEVYGFISLYISPIVIMAGYVGVIVAILKHSHTSSIASD